MVTAPEKPELAKEAIVAGRYRLVQELGEGAMGAVWLAEHLHMRKLFALKVLHPTASASAEIVARFEREAIAAAAIDHPGVVKATDFGRTEDGAFFLVLEYVPGHSLRRLIREGPVEPARAIEIARQMLLALGAAHAKGIVHRDIKPENIMLVRAPGDAAGPDVVKVLDFGIAKIDANSLGSGNSASPLTQLGAIYGTPTYMAPEQALGQPIDARADLYAVGVVLFELITGRPPFEGSGIEILTRHVREAPPPLVAGATGHALPEIEAFVRRLMAKDPAARPADAAQAALEIDQTRSDVAQFSDVFSPVPAPAAPSPTTPDPTSGTARAPVARESLSPATARGPHAVALVAHVAQGPNDIGSLATMTPTRGSVSSVKVRTPAPSTASPVDVAAGTLLASHVSQLGAVAVLVAEPPAGAASGPTSATASGATATASGPSGATASGPIAPEWAAMVGSSATVWRARVLDGGAHFVAWLRPRLVTVLVYLESVAARAGIAQPYRRPAVLGAVLLVGLVLLLLGRPRDGTKPVEVARTMSGWTMEAAAAFERRLSEDVASATTPPEASDSTSATRSSGAPTAPDQGRKKARGRGLINRVRGLF